MTASLEGKITLSSKRSVLAVVRNGASAFRTLEVIKLFNDDERLNVRMTVGPRSRYGYGVEQLLTSERIRLLPWDVAKVSAFDLILSGSANVCLSELQGPVVLFPHGAGHHKRPPMVSSGDRVFELTADQLLHNGSTIASKHLLPGRDSMNRLRRDCAPAADRALIAGDPIAQQLHEHVPLRDAYRADLGLRPGQRLVVVSSTWGPRSLAGQSLGLLKRLVTELPADEYRVAASFHHNVTIHDGHRELERILRAAIDSGLILIPPKMGWQSAVIAADCVIGDHGSTTFYAADIAPVAIAAYAPDECPDDSPMTALINAVPHIDENRPIRPQVEALICQPRPEAVTTIIDSSIDRQADAAAIFRSTMYDLMGLDDPGGPDFLPLVKSRPDRTEVTAYLVHPTVTDDRENTIVALARYPAAIAPMRDGRHLVVRTDDPDPRRAQSATALVAVNTEPDLNGLLARFPGCRVAAKPLTPDHIALHVHDGTEFTVSIDPPPGPDAAAFAASAYIALAEVHGQLNTDVTVECGGRAFAMSFRRSSTR